MEGRLDLDPRVPIVRPLHVTGYEADRWSIMSIRVHSVTSRFCLVTTCLSAQRGGWCHGLLLQEKAEGNDAARLPRK